MYHYTNFSNHGMQYWVRRDPLKDKVRIVTKEIKDKKAESWNFLVADLIQ